MIHRIGGRKIRIGAFDFADGSRWLLAWSENKKDLRALRHKGYEKHQTAFGPAMRKIIR